MTAFFREKKFEFCSRQTKDIIKNKNMPETYNPEREKIAASIAADKTLPSAEAKNKNAPTEGETGEIQPDSPAKQELLSYLAGKEASFMNMLDGISAQEKETALARLDELEEAAVELRSNLFAAKAALQKELASNVEASANQYHPLNKKYSKTAGNIDHLRRIGSALAQKRQEIEVV